jgi:hypothetical protein
MRVFALVVTLVAAGCTTSRLVGQPNLSVREDTISLVRHDKVDILFMVDNSPSMAPKQDALRQSFPQLVDRIANLSTTGAPASFHIGVITSDLGAGPYSLNQGQCHPGGDNGQLRTAASPSVTNLPAACAGFTLPGGYIDYDSSTGTSNLGTLDVATAFTCLASVGESGCGFEHQLESVYRALSTPSPNPGFLRDDALLVVVLLTDEDDCSAPPDSTLFDPSSNGVVTYGTLHSFRCTQFGVTCDGKPLTGGAISSTSCVPVTGGPLFDVARYTQLFGDGGVKQSRSDVLLVSFAAPSLPFDVTVTQPCADQVNTPSCAMLAHSCSKGPSFFGDPAVRINSVVAAMDNAVSASICEADYANTLDSMADAMAAQMRAGCLPGAIVDLRDPGCVVTVGGAEAVRCNNDGRLPCWDLVDDMGCPARMTPAGATQRFRFVVEGNLSAAPVVATCPFYEPIP